VKPFNCAVSNVDELLDAHAYGPGALIRWEASPDDGVTWAEGGTVALVTAQTTYRIWDVTGVDTTIYRTRISTALWPADATSPSGYSDATALADGWPTLDEFKQRIDIPDDDTDWDGTESGSASRLSRLLAAAIAQTKARIGDWDDTTDTPTERQAQSALELACEYAMKTPDIGRRISRSQQLLMGSRNRFGTA
jgi:hypothetical protein